MRVLIVGNGIAGGEVAFGLRRAGSGADITILSAETSPEYDPCSLPYYLGGEVPRERVFRRRWEDYHRAGIRLETAEKAVSIDPAARCVRTASGREHPYDRLVLAHGGSLFVPPIPGIDKRGIHGCKQLPDADRLDCHQGSHAVVIGSGAIGIEAAEALKKRGYAVTVIEVMDWILPALFDPETAGRLKRHLERCGIAALTGEKVMSIEGAEAVAAVVTDRRTIPCDTVVLATGIVPGVELARTAGIDVGRGIRVNERLETSLPGIYACGDCVETVDACTGEDAMFQLKHNALEQARVVTRNLLGAAAVYPGAWAFARAHFFDTHAVTFGKTTRATQCELGDLEIVEREEGDDYLRVIVKEGVIVGGQAIGRFADAAGLLMGAMWRRESVPALRARRALLGDGPHGILPWTTRRLGELLGLAE